ncbi:fatty acid desaturase family protein [Flavihumibacter petaseus]|uniref:Fatty acid desaturase n=1 Tax=Flavihumibacter petaseus NBRC 106054 TaxID=1220578 RepID=A0A0E9MZL4_9BACT|nr:acyl-CoA desaturase [Flavihumibacter petaseus]GAO43192.1 fatty acid desaturase [Flavihumibacter petaseus NBRC 106054]
MKKLTFNNKQADFSKTLNRAADQYFSSRQLAKTGNWRLYSKTIVLISVAVLAYLVFLFIPMNLGWMFPLGLLLGVTSACIGFNVMHDANHQSYSSRKWVNQTLGFSLNALGGNSFIWKYKHNVIHHTYTNIDGIDDDIAKSPLIRLCPSQPWVRAHRFQHLYTPVLYALSSLIWVLVQDYDKYFRPRLGDQAMAEKMPLNEHIIFWVSKAMYLAFYIVIPIVVVGWLPWLVFFLCLHVGLGLTLAVVFQLAHVVEGPTFETAHDHEHKKIEDEWAIHQIKTTANFSPNSRVITWLVGGLNYQIEHHLFPRVSHVHYPALSKIVRATCAQFNLPYHCMPDFASAVNSHFKQVKQLGRDPKLAL